MSQRELIRQTTALILAGGLGTRFMPLTKDRAKPAVPFAGKYRLIDIPVSNCLNSGFGRILVMTQTLAQSLNQHIHKAWAPLFPAERDNFIEVVSPQQRVGKKWYEGTADCVHQNLFRIGQDNPRWVIILSADHLYRMNYLDLLQFHVDHDADVTIASIPVPLQDAKHFGILETDANHQVSKFKEKPKTKVKAMPGLPGHCMASMGIYVWNTRALVASLECCVNIQREEHDFGKHVIPEALASKMRVSAYPFVDEQNNPCYWQDVGRLKTYHQAHMELMSPNPRFDLYDNDWSWHTAPTHLPLAKIPLSARIRGGSMISDGCIIDEADIDRSILSPNVRVGKNVTIVNSLVFDNVEIGDGAHIENAIIDKHNVIPANAIISPGQVCGFDLDPLTKIEDGIIAIPKRNIPWCGWVNPEHR